MRTSKFGWVRAQLLLGGYWLAARLHCYLSTVYSQLCIQLLARQTEVKKAPLSFLACGFQFDSGRSRGWLLGLPAGQPDLGSRNRQQQKEAASHQRTARPNGHSFPERKLPDKQPFLQPPHFSFSIHIFRRWFDMYNRRSHMRIPKAERGLPRLPDVTPAASGVAGGGLEAATEGAPSSTT